MIPYFFYRSGMYKKHPNHKSGGNLKMLPRNRAIDGPQGIN